MDTLRRLVSISAAFVSLAVAQESRGWILGRVTDPSGSSATGARVSATNTNTNTTLTGVTNQEGNYEIPYLLPGPYVVTAELAGFNKAIRNNVTIRTADRIVLDFQLQVGNLAESVTVSAEPPPLETATASSGLLLDERRIRELPVVGGNAMYLTRLAPGVTVSGGHSAGNPMDLGGATGVIVNGTRGGNSEASLDGVPNMQGTSSAFSPPQDLVQEFKVQTTNYDASIGRASGAVVNVSMKSGTNALHGTVYLNDSRIRSVPWFSSGFLHNPATGPITEQKRKQAAPGWLHQRWGATASGPISIPKIYNGKNRSFWTFGYEGVKINRQPTVFETVPTESQKRGDFSQLLAAGSVYQIYDPMTIQAAPNGRFSRQPLAGNIVPASRISPIASAIAKFYPAANVAGTADGRQNFFTVQREPKDYKGFVSRLDHTFSEKHRVFGRVNWTDYLTGVQTLPTIAQGTITTQDNFSAVLDDVYVLSPRLLVNVRAGFTFFGANTYPESRGFDITTLGFQKSLVDQIQRLANPTGMAFPVVYVDDDAITQLSSEGGTPANRAYQSYQGTITSMMGNHSMRFGGDLRIYRESTGGYGNVAPRLEFGKGWTRGPLDTSPVAPIGQGLASMMLGLPTGGRVNVNSSAAEQSSFSALFFHDDWKLSRKLTLNMGLRWELDSGLTERYNRSLRRFLTNEVSPISAQAAANYARSPIAELPVSNFATLGGLSFANVGGEPRSLWNADRNNFAPRFGFAYQLNPDTVIRSGYGIFFVQSGADRQGVNQGGFNQATNLIPSNNNGLNFVATLANPFPNGIDPAPGASQGLRTFLGRGISFFRDERKIGYQQRWSVSIQRTLPLKSMIDVQYVGNRGTGLEVSANINAIPAQYLRLRRCAIRRRSTFWARR